jgi:hypothetical protein
MASLARVRQFDRRRAGLALLGIGISAVAVWLCVRSIDVGEVAHQLGHAQAGPLVVLVMVLAVQTAVRAFRWSLLLPRRDSRRIATRRTLPPMLVGYLGNAILPARMGEPVRALLLARRENLAVAATFGSVVLERVVDTATLALIVLPAAWMAGAPRWILDAATLAAVVAGVVLAVLSLVGLAGPAQAINRFSRRLGQGRAATLMTELAGRFREFAMGVGASHRRPAILVAALLSVLAWAMDATLIWLAALSLGITLEPADAILIAGVAALGTAVPSAPGYVGTYELAATATSVALGVAPESALAVAILAHALTLLPMAGAGVVALLAIQRAGPRGAAAASPATADGDPSPPVPSAV